MNRILLTLLLAGAMLGCQVAEDQERRCIRTGMMEPRACEYEIGELGALAADSPSQGVLIDGHLQRSNGKVTLTQNRDGTGDALRLGAMHDPDIDDAFLDALVGIRVVIYGIYQPQAGALEVYSMRWVKEPDGRRPEWK